MPDDKSRHEGRSQGIAICLFLLVYFASRLISLNALPIFLDEAVHLQWAERLYGEGRILRPVGAGRVLAVAAYGLALPFEDRLWAARTVATIAGSVTLVFAMLLAWRFFGRRAGLVAGVLYLVSPFALVYDRLALSDGFLSATLTALMFVVVRVVTEPALGTARWVSMGCLLALAVASKVSALLFLGFIPLGIFCLAAEPAGAVRRLVKPVVFGLVLASPMLWFFYANSGEIGAQHVIDPLTDGSAIVSTLRDMGGWLTAYVTVPTLLMAVLSLFILRSKVAVWLALSSVLPFFFFALFSQPWSARYVLPILPPLLVLVAGGVDAFGSRLKARQATLTVSLLTLVTSLVAVPFTVRLLTDPASAPFPTDDRNQLVTGWPSGYGVREAAERLTLEATRGPLVAYVDVGGMRTLPTGMAILVGRNSAIRLVEVDLGTAEVRNRIVRSVAQGERVFALLGPRPQDLDFRGALKDVTVDRIAVYQRPGGEWAATLFEVRSAAPASTN